MTMIEKPLWIHAVSVGEFLAAKSLLRRLNGVPVCVSTTTMTGQNLAKQLLPRTSFYFPFDWAWSIRRVFHKIQPRAILVMETEIWPNFLWESRQQNVPIVLVNGRISDRSFPRYRAMSRFLPKFNRCLMQTELDASRMLELGYSKEQVAVMGNLKFDFHPPVLTPQLKQLLENWKGGSLLLIAGSTMPGEEDMLLDSLKDTRIKLLIAPRHPERFDEVAKLLESRGRKFVLRTTAGSNDTDVMLLDSIGELAAAYEFADIVLIGGTLKDFGGHNPIEPAYFGKPIVSGPYYRNFRGVFEEFQKRNAIAISSDWASAVMKLLQSPDERKRMGDTARKLVQQNAGAADFVLKSIQEYL